MVKRRNINLKRITKIGFKEKTILKNGIKKNYQLVNIEL